MNRRFIQIGRLLTVVTLFGLLELHWAGLQSLAWVQMIAADLREEPATGVDDFIDVVVRNVGSDVQCHRCLAIAEERASDKERELEQRAERRVEVVPAGMALIAISPGAATRLPVVGTHETADPERARPLVPPPRLA